MSGTEEALRLFGVTMIGATPENLRKLLLTLALLAGILLVTWLVRSLLRTFIGTRGGTRFHFWARQVVSLSMAVLLLLGIASIWFDNPARLATVLALISAGIAFALQRVITAVAGYFIILRGKTCNVGDRIVMGGVRGDVISLSFMQTKIMEMGQSPPEQGDAPSMWVRSRQFTGRIVTVSNAQIFDEPVYNYTHQFPYLWDEISLQLHFTDDRERAEQILLEAGRRHAVTSESMGAEERGRLKERYGLDVGDIDPKVYLRLSQGWLELSLRFLSPDHGTRNIKDAITRDLLTGFAEAGINVASSSLEITALPPLRIERAPAPRKS
ncbi:MAG TPA: mechanosensitive ion channel domain-containing protein [Sphingomicrobium sp.]|nr:mechanosensitive ion channel domain-containing protein [Sphingomicrobium sp.]